MRLLSLAPVVGIASPLRAGPVFPRALLYKNEGEKKREGAPPSYHTHIRTPLPPLTPNPLTRLQTLPLNLLQLYLLLFLMKEKAKICT